ncbi:MAG: hypothetical protein DCC68_09140 [Planctomycetota bacterium]|nr:MAG: hypothetical protein DCC68_09140 [Planctomycetota bacterium]
MDARLLAHWLGAEGLRAALEKSKKCSVDLLREVALSLDIPVTAKPKRQDLVDEIVRVATKRIDRPVQDLLKMQREELIRYFEANEVEPQELLDLLRELNMEPGREGRRNLLEFVARELSETGRFVRIATHGLANSS